MRADVLCCLLSGISLANGFQRFWHTGFHKIKEIKTDTAQTDAGTILKMMKAACDVFRLFSGTTQRMKRKGGEQYEDVVLDGYTENPGISPGAL